MENINKYFIEKEECVCEEECESCRCSGEVRGFKVVRDECRKHPDVEIQLPTRGTKFSSCYDIRVPVEVVIPPHSHSELIFTDLCSYMLEDEVLMLHVRSSIGCKRGLILSNCTPIIDCDYFYADNGGNVALKFYNTTDKEVVLEANERVVQGMFIKYLTVDNDEFIKESRHGGLGHSGKK